MKFLFVVKSKFMETLGPMYLAAIVKKAGHEAKICEFNEAIFMAFDWRPDIIGYSCMTGDQDKFKKLNHAIRAFHDFNAAIGGPHATFFPQDFLQFDYLITGEAEVWLADLLDYKPGSINLYELDSIPFPDRTDFPDMKIRDFMSSRGCPFECTYCFNKKWHDLYPGKKVRYRSVDNVIAEVLEVDPEFAYFQDSCFGVSMDWFVEFAHKYAEKVKRPYHCHLRPRQVTIERARLLAYSGCVSTRIALETVSPRLRELIGRPKSNNEETIKAARILRDHGIELMIQNMLALPTSTIEDDLATLETNILCQPAYGWSSIFAPFPGTELGDMCKQKRWYRGDYSDITDCFFDKSVLDFPEEYKEQTYVLQKIFALAVEAQVMPELYELTLDTMPEFIHRAMRRIGDNRLYGGVI